MEGREFKNLKRQWNISQCGWGMSGWEPRRVSVKWSDSDAYKLVQAWRAVGCSRGNDVPSLYSSTNTHSHIHTHIHTYIHTLSHPTHTAFKQGAHLKLVISLIHSDNLETQCRLTSVLYTPYIRKMNRPWKHRERKRERKREKEEEDKVVNVVFSLTSFLKKKTRGKLHLRV